MKGIQQIAFVALLMLVSTVTFAQQKGKVNRANQLFKDLNYQEAIELYLEILDKNDVPEAKINIAEAYRKVGNNADAEYWYGQVVRLNDAKPVHKLYYGMALQANGKCDQAKQWFDEYTALVPDDLRGQLLKKSCEELMIDRLLKAGAIYKVTNVTKLNTSYDDFGVAYLGDGVVFSSERDKGSAFKRVHSWTGHPFLELFSSKTTLLDPESMEYKYGAVDKYSNKINTRFHDGPVTFSNDFNEMYFTRNNIEKGKAGKDDEGIIRLKIFGAKKEGDAWGKIEGLPFNSDEYSVAHPALNQDGTKLYFSSDMPGGFGGMDLYVTMLENGRWSPPVNLGPTLNTEGNELFPFFHVDGTLFFSSNGHTGLGGLDIFSSKESGNNNWSSPINVGYPVNTISDDFGIILNAERTHGYFCSNREGGVGMDDIYSFSRFAANVEVLVFDKNTGKPIDDAEVKTNFSALPNFRTGADGKYSFQLPLDQLVNLVASKELYEQNQVDVTTKGKKPNDNVFVQIALEQPLNFSTIVSIKDEKTGSPLAGARVVLESDCGQESQTVVTDDKGAYEFNLRPNCCYTVKVDKEGYSNKKESFCTNNMDPKNPRLDLPIAVVSNTPVVDSTEGVLKHIYYNFDRSEIRDEAIASLDGLYDLMNNNPTVIVEIGSHTDSRASNKYNERLSTRRAQSVVRYLVQKGIAKDRLKAKGYGETAHVNNCYDDVPCTEEEHQKNRRTEFKVVGTMYGVEKTMESTAPADIIIDRCNKCPF